MRGKQLNISMKPAMWSSAGKGFSDVILTDEEQALLVERLSYVAYHLESGIRIVLSWEMEDMLTFAHAKTATVVLEISPKSKPKATEQNQTKNSLAPLAKHGNCIRNNFRYIRPSSKAFFLS
jgi:hypothetical protein